ncbi:Transposon Ty3-I Gag-Pol poly [Paramuricea clavata]|uniref:Transposon Ty3-I Gag-Pol poly n=1 Tax=Paramuricea clavata TaxID=317549 RepID=A0A6S7HUF3_PARCT|nr:Transposon Ty3-I Gag-Pol poly [Paramuricea clavata]
MVCNLPISEESLTMIKQATEVDNDLEKLKTGERLVIPYGVRSHIKARIHASHIGVQGCLRSARDSVYWQKEPLISHAIPERPWEKLDQLRSKTSNEIIAKLKSLFARYGVPDQLITDNGPPYNSEAVREFAREFEFEHITSSPGYPKSNGKSENAVRTAKRLVKKARESGRDPYLSLLDWRNTRYQDCGT